MSSDTDFDKLGKIREEWSFRSVLVSVDNLSSALEIVSFSDTKIKPGWQSSGKFDFGESASIRNIELLPWVHIWESPLDRSLVVKIRDDFINYHCLQQKDENVYLHPVDGIEVINKTVEQFSFFSPSARVEVHRDYLRDYLAARKMSLLISIVADRFANAFPVEALGIEPNEYVRIDDHTHKTCVIQPPGALSEKYYTGRSSLYRNVVILPYDLPRLDRTPWYYFGEIPKKFRHPVAFIIDEEGNRAELHDKKCPKYLYFKPYVLKKYLEVKNFRVNFHMRNWGIAQDVISQINIDIGINSKGLVNAFAPDLAKLSSSEQSYWASYSSIPSGEICEELYQTRMLLNPPDSKSVVEEISDALSKLNSSFNKQFSEDLYDGSFPSDPDAAKMNVGPLGQDIVQLVSLGKLLYEFVIERMPISVLRKPVEHIANFDKEWKQIKLLEEIVILKTHDDTLEKEITDPLRGLNIIRIGSAHHGAPKITEAFNLLGYPSLATDIREAWEKCIGSISSTLIRLSKIIDS